MLFQVRPGPVTYNEAVQQKKRICNSISKSAQLKKNCYFLYRCLDLQNRMEQKFE